MNHSQPNSPSGHDHDGSRQEANGDARLRETLGVVDRELPTLPAELLERVKQAGAKSLASGVGVLESGRWTRTAWRGALAMAAAVCLMLLLQSPSANALTLREVLEHAAGESLVLKVSRDERTADVWVDLEGQVRWQESPERYQIASGSS